MTTDSQQQNEQPKTSDPAVRSTDWLEKMLHTDHYHWCVVKQLPGGGRTVIVDHNFFRKPAWGIHDAIHKLLMHLPNPVIGHGVDGVDNKPGLVIRVTVRVLYKVMEVLGNWLCHSVLSNAKGQARRE
jgi:hypothetical protein